MYNIKQETALLTLAKAELANTTSCPSTKGSTEAQLFLNGITSGQTGRSTQAQSECSSKGSGSERWEHTMELQK